MRIKEEDILQQKCVMWFNHNYRHNHHRMLFHVDNNSWNATVGAIKKGLGVVQGPSDLILIVECDVIFLEAKTPSGTQLPEQVDFMNKVKERGHKYIIFRTFEEFQSIIKKYLPNG